MVPTPIATMAAAYRTRSPAVSAQSIPPSGRLSFCEALFCSTPSIEQTFLQILVQAADDAIESDITNGPRATSGSPKNKAFGSLAEPLRNVGTNNCPPPREKMTRHARNSSLPSTPITRRARAAGQRRRFVLCRAALQNEFLLSSGSFTSRRTGGAGRRPGLSGTGQYRA